MTLTKKWRIQIRRRKLSGKQQQLKKLEERVSALVELSTGNLQDEEVHEELDSIVDEHDQHINKLEQDDVRRIFWNQQVGMIISLLRN